MSVFSLCFLSIGLAMDCFAVSISSGITLKYLKQLKFSNALRIALFFGGFQAGMTALGWGIGFFIKDFVIAVDHWVAFGLLGFIGAKMIYEGFKIEEMEEKTNPLDWHILIMLSIATSIDALAVGVTLSFISVSIILSCFLIGVITLILSYAGVYIGEKIGHFFEKKIEIFGGLILIAIGIKILIQHLAG